MSGGKGRGTWGEANPQPQGMQPCKGEENQVKVSTFFPPKHTARVRRREKVFACKILRALQPIHAPFSPSNISLSLVSKPRKTQLKLKQKSVSIHHHSRRQNSSAEGSVVSPIFSSNSHILTSKVLHKLSFGC